jgi:hypothetical protein
LTLTHTSVVPWIVGLFWLCIRSLLTLLHASEWHVNLVIKEEEKKIEKLRKALILKSPLYGDLNIKCNMGPTFENHVCLLCAQCVRIHVS